MKIHLQSGRARQEQRILLETMRLEQQGGRRAPASALFQWLKQWWGLKGFWLAVSLAFLAVIQQGYFWHLDATPQHGDPALYLFHSLQLARDVGGHGIGALITYWVYGNGSGYPPAYGVLMAPAFGLFGYDIAAGLAWQGLYGVVTLIVLFAFMRHYYGDAWGYVGGLVYLCIPLVLGFSRMTYVANLLALEMAVVLYLLFPGRALEQPRRARVLGGVLGLGLVTQSVFLLFAGPLVLLQARHVAGTLRGDRGALRAQRAIGRGLVLALLLVAAPWYVAHASRLWPDLVVKAFASIHGDAPMWTLRGLLYYPQSLPWQIMGLPLTLAFGLGLYLACRHGTATPESRLWALALGVSVVLLSLSPRKEGRFLLPLLPLVVTLLIHGLTRLSGWPRRILVAGVIAFSGLNWAMQTVPLTLQWPEIKVPQGFGRPAYVAKHGMPEWLMMPASTNHWRLDEVAYRIKRMARFEKTPPTVQWVLGADHPYVNNQTLLCYAAAYGLEKVNLHRQAGFWIVTRQPFYPDGAVVADRRVYRMKTFILPDRTELRIYRCLP